MPRLRNPRAACRHTLGCAEKKMRESNKKKFCIKKKFFFGLFIKIR
jgi:hypothetical protein